MFRMFFLCRLRNMYLFQHNSSRLLSVQSTQYILLSFDVMSSLLRLIEGLKILKYDTMATDFVGETKLFH